MRYEVLNGSDVTVFSGGERARGRALACALAIVDAGAPTKDMKLAVVESTRNGRFTLIAWTVMFDRSHTSGFVWVLERASGMRSNECETNGIDWRAERDKRLSLGGEW